MKKNFTTNKNFAIRGGDYTGKSQQLLNKFNIKTGDDVKIFTNKGELIGIIMPRYESFNESYIVIKLKSGYNIGILVDNILSISCVNRNNNYLEDNISKKTFKNTESFELSQSPKIKDSEDTAELNDSVPLPKILLISTGGTIASRIDYRTGGVTSVLNASDLYDIFPELSDYGYIFPEFLFNEYSENLNPSHWSNIADRISFAVKNEQYDGIIISHGTDTMHYTSSALSFALHNIPIPVVLVGSQRSSDRPSSDAFGNLLGAIRFIKETKFAGIFVCMHYNLSDEIIACYLGTRVRKNHTSKRDAFKSLDSIPFALVSSSGIKRDKNLYKIHERTKSAENFVPKTSFDSHVFLLKFYPGFDPSFLEIFLNLDYKVIILEGTGLGHVNKNCFPYITKLINSGIIFLMTSQCIFGRVRMTVYDTGRDLLKLGVIPLSDMGSETALVKAMWALSNSNNADEFVKIMTMSISNEISDMLPIVY